jgi:acetyl esterase/lipase
MPRWIKRLAAPFMMLAALGGCSTTGVLGAVEPKAGVNIVRDLAYGEGPRQRLDVYGQKSKTGAPVVVFFYGGSWNSGSKDIYTFLGAALARHGYVVVIPDYRVYPQVVWPAFLQDSAQAVKWARDHAAEYGGDPRRLVLMGHSAGAYNAAELTYDKRWLAAVGMDPDRDVRALVGLAGPYDFLPLQSDELRTIFGPEQSRPATQPIAYVEAGSPPAFLAADLGDKVVDPGNVTRMAARIHQKGGRVETKMYGGLSHALMIGVFAWPLRGLAPVMKDSTAFIDAHTRP